MPDSKFNLEKYLSNGVENIIKGAIKASISNPKESIFIAKFVGCAKKASKIRHEQEKMGKQKDVGVLFALYSGLFEKIRGSGLQEEFHNGACALYGKDDQVKKMMN